MYARPDVEGEGYEQINEVRLNVLRDQLKLYEDAQVGWSIWLYKDIGFQGASNSDARFASDLRTLQEWFTLAQSRRICA